MTLNDEWYYRNVGMSYKDYEKLRSDIAIEQTLRQMPGAGPAVADLWAKARGEKKPVAFPTSNTDGLYLLFQPGKRNGVPALLIGTNPDGSVNLVGSEGGKALGFFLGVPTYTYDGGNDASKPYAKKATSVS